MLNTEMIYLNVVFHSRAGQRTEGGWEEMFVFLFVRLSFLLYVNKMRGNLGIKFTEAAVCQSNK